MCTSNTADTNRLAVFVNGIITSNGRGGTGNCALGINHAEQSDWQLSKVYVWNTHLSNEDLSLASLSLYSALFTDTTAAGVCLPCYRNSQSQAGASVCECNAGYTGQHGWLCKICPGNTFKSIIGPDSCTPCPANAASPSGTTLITVCRCRVEYFGADGGVCTACPGNSRSVNPSTEITNCKCNANYFGEHGGSCTLCPSNSKSVAWSLFITDCKCNANYFGEHGGSCTLCPSNSQSVAGSLFITDCKCNANYFGEHGGACTLCPSNSQSVAGSILLTDCVCKPGYFGENGGLCSIPVCPAGKYSSAPDHTVCNAAAVVPSYYAFQCSNGNDCNYPNCRVVGTNFGCWSPGFWGGGWLGSKCWQGGSAHSAGVCYSPVRCIDGCYDCPSNSGSVIGSNHMIDCKCNSGATGVDGRGCSLCVVGKYKTMTGSAPCNDCVLNSNSLVGSTSIENCLCNAGFSATDTGLCEACVAGKYKSETGSAPCTNCVPGKYSAAVGAISDVCQSCPTNTNSIEASGEQSDCTCNMGYTGNDGGPCETCIAGKYKSETGSAPCTNCVPGQYSAAVGAISNVCQSCPTNTNSIEGTDEQTDCTCNMGYTGDNGGPCEACIPGKYKVTLGDATCTNCVAGQYSTAFGATSDVCQTCPADSDSVQASDQQTKCICNSGYAGLNGGPCIICPPGKYWISNGVI